MPKTKKDAAEKLLEDAFTGLLSIAQREGITVKRMREILTSAQIHAMKGQGKTQQEIMAASGYSLKTIRRFLHNNTHEDNTDLVIRFVGDWTSDAEFPNILPLNGDEYPSFVDLCARYGGDFTPPSLVQILTERGQAEIKDGNISLHGKAVTPSPGSEMLDAARSAIRSLINTLDHNLSGARPPYMERRFWSHRMPCSAVPELRDRIRAHTALYREQILYELDRLEAETDHANEEQLSEVGVGVYWFEV